jgi:alpha-glucosidase (family GH31 glycosyl hydrolase)
MSDAGSDSGACVFTGSEMPIPDPPISTPRWAFEPWISKDISTADDTRAFVDGFIQRDIPVGVVVLDSPWETNYNTYEPNPSRYPKFADLVSELHGKNVRVVLWTTAFINTSSYDLEMGGDTYPTGHPQFEEGLACNFYVNGGQTEFWWKGTGASVDFFNPSARAWLHAMEDHVLDLGIDGWKLDFGESYIRNVPIATAAGNKTLQEYSEEYYADFYRYARKKKGAEFITMTRAWDESYQFTGRYFAKPQHSPVAWMGDNRRDFVGLADALNETFMSSGAGYAAVGSDVGGYLDKNDKMLTEDIPYDQAAFSRWVATSAMLPLMQLHGRANLTPWTVPVDPDAFVALYKYWATLHHELVPFFYGTTKAAHAGGPMPVQPIEGPPDFRFLLGGAFLVAPILDATGVRDVVLPSFDRWYDWWNEAADPTNGGTTLSAYDAKALDRMPLFVRERSIVPARVSNDITGLGTAGSKGALTLLVYPGAVSVGADIDDVAGTLHVDAQRTSSITVTLSSTPVTTILRVRTDTMPSQVTDDGNALMKHATHAAFDAAMTGWFPDPARRLTWVKLDTRAPARTVVLQ